VFGEMTKIDRMPRDLGIITHTALRNHNECVDKINEIIEAFNMLTEQANRQKCCNCEHFLSLIKKHVHKGADYATIEPEGVCQKGHGIQKQARGGLPLAYTCFDNAACADFSPISIKREEEKAQFNRSELADMGAALLFRDRIQDKELMAKINRLLMEEQIAEQNKDKRKNDDGSDMRGWRRMRDTS